MPSHMTSLGFPVATEQDFRHYTYQASEFGRTLETSKGSYIVWPPGYGIELWVQANLHKRIIGMNPHFRGYGKMRAYLTRRVIRREHTILEGAFYSWATPPGTAANKGLYPFVFEAPDYALYDALALPGTAYVQLAAFAQLLQGYENADAYKVAQGADPDGEFFISPALNTTPEEAPPAYATFSGHVLEAAVITNPITNLKFNWALVHTLGGAIDIIADPQVVQGNIAVNGMVKGTFWLSGRLV